MSLSDLRRAFASGEVEKPEYIERMHGIHSRLYEYAALLGETDISTIEICDGQVVMTFRESGIRMVCDPRDQRIAPVETLNFGRYEAKDAEMVFRLVRDGDRVYDVGANHGWYALHLARRFPGSVIDAFEPVPSSFGYLQRNLALNAVTNVRAHHFGLGDAPGEIAFYVYPEGSVNASMADLSGRSGVETVTCPVKCIDDLATGSPPPDFLKVDVEGAELLVFRGAIDTLRRTQAPVFTEMLRKWSARFDYHPNEIIALFAGLGYRCFRAEGGALTPFSSMDNSTMETNFFFLHPDRSGEHIRTLSQNGDQ